MNLRNIGTCLFNLQFGPWVIYEKRELTQISKNKQPSLTSNHWTQNMPWCWNSWLGTGKQMWWVKTDDGIPPLLVIGIFNNIILKGITYFFTGWFTRLSHSVIFRCIVTTRILAWENPRAIHVQRTVRYYYWCLAIFLIRC